MATSEKDAELADLTAVPQEDLEREFWAREKAKHEAADRQALLDAQMRMAARRQREDELCARLSITREQYVAVEDFLIGEGEI